MLNKSINKHGLKRYIPSDIREKIRKNSGFGCVICGCVLVDYEHIDPEFHDAKEHDPDNMTLLCISCHGRVTRKLISKKSVWDAKSNPKALQNGYVHDLLFVNTADMEIKIGNSYSKNTKLILTIYGKPIIWFEPPLVKGEPSKLCAIFYDDNGSAISYINRNQFTAFSTNQDIRSEATNLSIKSNGIKCLAMNREGGEVLHISKMQARYLDKLVTIDKDGNLIITQGTSTSTLGNIHVISCGSAFHLGNHPSILKHRKVSLAIAIARSNSTTTILNLKNDIVGWCFGNELFNRNYEMVGFIRESKAFNIVNEYIGNLVGSHIVHNDDCYEDGEPIYVSKENRDFRDKHYVLGYDVSFRLFEFTI